MQFPDLTRGIAPFVVLSLIDIPIGAAQPAGRRPAPVPAETRASLLPLPNSGRACTPQTVNLTQDSRSLAGALGQIQDQDGIGTCYANTASLLLGASTGRAPSFIHLATLETDWIMGDEAMRPKSTPSGMPVEHELSLTGGFSCQVINEAISRHKACPRETSPLERHGFQTQQSLSRFVGNAQTQQNALEAFGNLISALRESPRAVRVAWRDRLDAQSLISSAQELGCHQSGAGDFQTQGIVLRIIQGAETRLENARRDLAEIQVMAAENEQQIAQRRGIAAQGASAPESTESIESLEETHTAISTVLSDLGRQVELEQMAIRNLSGAPSGGDSLRLSPATTARLATSRLPSSIQSLGPQLLDYRRTHPGDPSRLSIAGSPLEPAIRSFLADLGAPNDWIRQRLEESPKLNFSDFAELLQQTDPTTCQRNGLSTLLGDTGRLSSLLCTNIAPGAPGADPSLQRLETALIAFAVAAKDSEIAPEGMAQAISLAGAPDDFQQAFETLLFPHCSADPITLAPPLHCDEVSFPPAHLSSTSGAGAVHSPPREPRSPGFQTILRDFRRNTLTALESNRPVGLAICSAALWDPNVDRGNNQCTEGTHGFHAVTAVGYRIKEDCSIDYLIQNSWGNWCPTGQEANCEGNGRLWMSETALTRNTYQISRMSGESPPAATPPPLSPTRGNP